MRGLNIANRYAQSLLDLAEEMQKLDAVLKDMKAVLMATNNSREFYNFLKSPLIKEEKKEKILQKIFPDFQKISRNFIHLLVQKNRESFLPLIAEKFVDKLNRKRGIIPLTLVSAVELEEEVRERILKRLNENIEGSIQLHKEVEKSIIGGFIVKMGDTRIDASVTNQLKEIKQTLVK